MTAHTSALGCVREDARAAARRHVRPAAKWRHVMLRWMRNARHFEAREAQIPEDKIFGRCRACRQQHPMLRERINGEAGDKAAAVACSLKKNGIKRKLTVTLLAGRTENASVRLIE